jgi:uncharacterized GH25 family protein
MKRSIVAVALVGLAVSLAAVVCTRSGPDDFAPISATSPPAAASRGALRVATAATVVSEERIARDDDPAGELRLEGQVVALGEQPVEGAVVVIDSNPRREARTERDGGFAFTGLAARTYRVEARAGDSVAGPVGVTLRESTEPVVLRLLPAASFVIRAVDATSQQPIAGALVELRDLALATTATSAEGVARLGGVSTGTHLVKVSAAGYAPAYRELTSNGAPGASSEATFRLHRGVRAGGTVIDPSGRPVEDARVIADSASTWLDLADPRLDGALTDAKGRFEFSALSRATWRFRVSHPRYAPATSELVALGEPRDDIVIRVSLGGELRGRVVDDRGAPVPAADVRISGSSFQAGAPRYLRTDDQGRFALGGLPRSQVFVVASSEEVTSPLVEVDLGRAGVKEVEIPLRLTGGIEGIVVTSAGQPVPEARVVAVPALTNELSEQVENRLRGPHSEVADADGRFRLAPLPDGRYRVRAIRADAPTEVLSMKAGVMVESGARGLRITVDDLTSLHGKVRFEDGGVPTVFRVAVGGGRAAPFGGDDGHFRIDHVPAGRRSLIVGGPELVRQFEDKVDLEPGVDNDLGTITVHRGRTVRGRVIEPGGAPVAGAAVAVGPDFNADGWNLVPYERISIKQAATGADGRFTIAGVESNQQVMSAEHEQRGRATIAEIAPGKTDIELTLTLQPFASLQGTLRADSRPISGAIALRASNAPNAQFAVDTGPDGTYRFDRLAAGKYLLFGVQLGGSEMDREHSHLQTVALEPGQSATLDIDLSTGSIALTVVLRSPGDTVEYGLVSAVLLLPGTVLPSTMPATLDEGRKALSQLGAGQVSDAWIVSNRRVKMDRMKPGRYVVCAIPLGGPPDDPEVMALLTRDTGRARFYCSETTITESPAEQEVAVSVQPAK